MSRLFGSMAPVVDAKGDFGGGVYLEGCTPFLRSAALCVGLCMKRRGRCLSRTFPTRQTEDDAACGERKVADGPRVQRRRRGCRSSLRLPRWSQTSGTGYEIENRSHLRTFRWSLSANTKEREPLFISVWKGHVAGRSGQAIPAAGRRRAQAVFNDIHKLRVTDSRIFARS